MAINDINIISPVESSQNIIIPQKKKEKKKKEQNLKKSADNIEDEQNAPENDHQAIMADNDEHLLDFKA